MAIRKGEDWGVKVPRPSNLLILNDDASVNHYVSEHFDDPQALPPLSILNSNLGRALGLSGANTSNDLMLCTKFDAISVNFKLENGNIMSKFFLGHAMLRNSWFRGKILGIFNTSFENGRDWAPRAHPNDSKLDLVSVDQNITIRERLAISRRLKFGAHLPHPKIEYRQIVEYQAQLLEPTGLYLDGVYFGRVVECKFDVVPDAVSLCW